MTNVILPDRTWVDLYAATGITVGNLISVINITPDDVKLAFSELVPTTNDDIVPLLFGRGSGHNDFGDPGAWALCNGGGAINVNEGLL